MALPIPVENGCNTLPDGLVRLSRRHRTAIAAHFERLPQVDRIRRFGKSLCDAEIVGRVAALDFGRDGFVGTLTPAGAITALAQVSPSGGAPGAIDVAISVDPAWRGRGLGARLIGAVVAQWHDAAPTSVVAIDVSCDRSRDLLRIELGLDASARPREVCSGIRIAPEPIPSGAHRIAA